MHAPRTFPPFILSQQPKIDVSVPKINCGNIPRACIECQSREHVIMSLQEVWDNIFCPKFYYIIVNFLAILCYVYMKIYSLLDIADTIVNHVSGHHYRCTFSAFCASRFFAVKCISLSTTDDCADTLFLQFTPLEMLQRVFILSCLCLQFCF